MEFRLEKCKNDYTARFPVWQLYRDGEWVGTIQRDEPRMWVFYSAYEGKNDEPDMVLGHTKDACLETVKKWYQNRARGEETWTEWGDDDA